MPFSILTHYFRKFISSSCKVDTFKLQFLFCFILWNSIIMNVFIIMCVVCIISEMWLFGRMEGKMQLQVAFLILWEHILSTLWQLAMEQLFKLNKKSDICLELYLLHNLNLKLVCVLIAVIYNLYNVPLVMMGLRLW